MARFIAAVFTWLTNCGGSPNGIRTSSTRRRSSTGASQKDCAIGSIDQVVLKRFPKLNGWRGYVCGDPDLVKSLKKKLFLSGMASRDIYSDAFLPAAQAL